LGTGGRVFESRYPDHLFRSTSQHVALAFVAMGHLES
jgi:hypothetical protein